MIQSSSFHLELAAAVNPLPAPSSAQREQAGRALLRHVCLLWAAGGARSPSLMAPSVPTQGGGARLTSSACLPHAGLQLLVCWWHTCAQCARGLCPGVVHTAAALQVLCFKVFLMVLILLWH